MKRTSIFWFTGSCLVTAVIVHFALLTWLPSMIMAVVFKRGAQRQTSGAIIIHSPPATAKTRTVVMMSPDLLYSACALDLSKGTYKIKAFVPKSYWSLSGYDDQTNNVFVVNERTTGSGWHTWTVVGPDSKQKGKYILKIPHSRVFVIFRTLITDNSKQAHFQGIQKKASCTLSK